MIPWKQCFYCFLLLDAREEVEEAVLFGILAPFIISEPEQDPEQSVVTNPSI